MGTGHWSVVFLNMLFCYFYQSGRDLVVTAFGLHLPTSWSLLLFVSAAHVYHCSYHSHFPSVKGLNGNGVTSDLVMGTVPRVSSTCE